MMRKSRSGVTICFPLQIKHLIHSHLQYGAYAEPPLLFSTTTTSPFDFDRLGVDGAACSLL